MQNVSIDAHVWEFTGIHRGWLPLLRNPKCQDGRGMPGVTANVITGHTWINAKCHNGDMPRVTFNAIMGHVITG